MTRMTDEERKVLNRKVEEGSGIIKPSILKAAARELSALREVAEKAEAMLRYDSIISRAEFRAAIAKWKEG